MDKDRFERVEVASREELRAWLQANHAKPDSIWLVTWRKADPVRHLPYDAIVEEALCFGWVDSLPRKLDAQRTMLLLSPRKPGSAWSGVNKARVARLEQDGLLHPAGRAKIEAARRDSSWSFLDDVERLEVPPDMAEAFASDPVARNHFDAFPPSTRRGILEWIKQARQPATRARRIAETVRLAHDDIRANQFQRKPPATEG